MLGRVLGDCEMKTIYTIPAPDSLGAMIEVYGEPENAWYEWRIIDGGRTVRDTGTEGHSAFQGRQYGQAEIALRDALMFASGLPIDGDTPTDAASLEAGYAAKAKAKRRGRVREHPAAPNHNRSTQENSMALDIMAAFTNEPPELDFIWPGFLAGTVGALVAPGATGKSFFALEAAMSIACSVAGGDLVGLAPAHTGRVVYLAGEDPQPALVRRVHAIGQHLNQSAREAIAENLMLEPIMGKRLNVMDEAHLRRVIDYSAGARLIVLDTLSRIHSLDENSNGDMAHLVSVLEHIAATTGAAVLYLHHVNKGSARDGQTDQQQAARGASALIDNARWCGYVAKMTEQEAERLSDRGFDRAPIGNERRGLFVRFGVSKQNYDATPLDRWYQRHTGGVLLPVELQEIKRESGNKGGKGYDSAAY